MRDNDQKENKREKWAESTVQQVTLTLETLHWKEDNCFVVMGNSNSSKQLLRALPLNHRLNQGYILARLPSAPHPCPWLPLLGKKPMKRKRQFLYRAIHEECFIRKLCGWISYGPIHTRRGKCDLEKCNKTTTPSPCQSRGCDHKVVSVTDHTVLLQLPSAPELPPFAWQCCTLPETETHRQALQFLHHSLQVINNSYKDSVWARNSRRKFKKASQNDITAFSFSFFF